MNNLNRIFKLIGCLSLLAVSMLSPISSAQVDKAVAETLMKQSGMWKQLESAGPQMRDAFVAAASAPESKLSPDDGARLARAAESAFAPSVLCQQALAVVAENLQAASEPALTKWFTSSLGKKISEIEERETAAMTDPAEAGSVGEKKLLAANPKRLALIHSIVKSTRMAESMTDLMMNMTNALAYGMVLNAAVPGALAPALKDVMKATEPQRKIMLDEMRGLAPKLTAHIYTELTDAELATYDEFLRSPAGQQFTAVGVKGTDSAFVHAALNFGKIIIEFAKQQKA